MNTNRIEALSDALFAIVLTILILEIKVPHLGDPINSTELLQGLELLVPKFVSFFISFVVIGIFWIGHHNQFPFIERSNRVFLWINIIFFCFVSLIPFSANLLGEYPLNPVSSIFYGSNLFIVGMALYAHWNYAVMAGLTKKLSSSVVTAANKRILVGPACYFLGALTAVINPRLSLVLFIVPVIVQILPGRIDRHLR